MLLHVLLHRFERVTILGVLPGEPGRMKDRATSLKPRKQQQQHHHHQNNEELPPFSFYNLLNSDANWDKEQLCDALHWIRQAIALFCGIMWGAIPLVGGFWLLLFLVLSSGVIYGYYMYILKIEEEEYGGHGNLLQEGLFASVTLFLLAWILVYSLIHF
eukprot:c22960_g2_i2 orf=423-899(+)